MNPTLAHDEITMDAIVSVMSGRSAQLACILLDRHGGSCFVSHLCYGSLRYTIALIDI